MIFPDLSRVDRVGVDTETTGLTTRDRPVGLSWATPDGRKAYARWGHERGGNNCSWDEARRWAEAELDRPGLTVYMHNAGFDGRMLAYQGFQFRRARVEDTGFMAALHDELEPNFSLDALGEKHCGLRKRPEKMEAWVEANVGPRKKVGNFISKMPGDVVEEYAEFDAYNTLKLADALRPRITEQGLEEIYEVETALIPILLRMHLVGVRVDRRKAVELKKQLVGEKVRLLARWNSEVGEVNHNSTPQLAKLFQSLEISHPYTEKGNPSITADFLDTVDHPVAAMIRRLRKLDHYSGTFIDSYILSNVDDRDLIHGEFHPLRNDRYGTVSGRLSSGGELNLQNVPSRDEEFAPLIRGLFIPISPQHDWLRADYSQIEFRYLAHYAGGAIREAYNRDPLVDFHQACADLVNIPRKPAKNINFGIVYGMGVKLMAQKLGLPFNEAKALLAEYHDRLPEVQRIYKKADRIAGRRGYITTWGGRKRRFKKRGRWHANTHKALNALLQGSAADLIKKAMIRIDAELDWEATPLHLTVHDELDLSVPKGDEEFPRRVKELMQDFELTVPVIADLERGPDWGHCEEIPELKEAA